MKTFLVSLTKENFFSAKQLQSHTDDYKTPASMSQHDESLSLLISLEPNKNMHNM